MKRIAATLLFAYCATLAYAQSVDWKQIKNKPAPFAPYTQSFTSQTAVAIPGSSHGYRTSGIIMACYDSGSPAHQIEPAQIYINTLTYDVTVLFASPQSGFCTVYGGTVSDTFAPKSVFDVTQPAYGAKCNGITDDSAAFRLAFAAMGSTPTGVFFVPNTGHTCRLASTVEMNLGYPNATSADTATTGTFELRMDGAIRPDAGIGVALWIHHGYSPTIHYKIDGGGQWGDSGLKLNNLSGVRMSAQCKDYAGTSWEAVGTGGADAIQMSSVDSSISANCGRNFYLYHLIGFGNIADVEDSGSAHAAMLDQASDVTIEHFEGDYNLDPIAGLIISNSGAAHLGTVAVGGNPTATALISVVHSTNVSFHKIYLNGNAIAEQDGLLVADGSRVSVDDINAGFFRYAIQNQGSKISVKNFYDEASVTHYFQTSFGANHTAYGDLHVDTIGAVAESYLVDPSLTSGYLRLSGVTTGGKIGGTGGYDVKSTATGVAIILSAFSDTQPNSALAGTVGVPTSELPNLIVDPASALALGVAATDGGRVAAPFTSWNSLSTVNNNLIFSYPFGIKFCNTDNSVCSLQLNMGATTGMEIRAGQNGYGYLEDSLGNPIMRWTAGSLADAANNPIKGTLNATLTTTSATSDNVAVPGMTATGHCTLQPWSASAATNLSTTFMSSRTVNQITVTHAAVSGMVYDVSCTP